MNPQLIDKYRLTATNYKPYNIISQEAIYYEHPTGLMVSIYSSMGKRLSENRVCVINFATGVSLDYSEEYMLENEVSDIESWFRKVLIF